MSWLSSVESRVRLVAGIVEGSLAAQARDVRKGPSRISGRDTVLLMVRYEEMLEAFRAGDNELTRRLSSEALEAAGASGEVSQQVDALCMLARVALREGDPKRVGDLANQARSRARTDRRLERMPLHMQAVAARMSGRYDEARRLYEESIELNQSLGEERMVAAEYHNLAYVELRDGRPDRAKELFKQARDQAQRVGYEALHPYLVGDLAVIAAIDADAATAARLAGAAAGGFAAAGQVPDPDDAAEQERLREQLAQELGAERFRTLYEEGASLTPTELLANPANIPAAYNLPSRAVGGTDIRATRDEPCPQPNRTSEARGKTATAGDRFRAPNIPAVAIAMATLEGLRVLMHQQ